MLSANVLVLVCFAYVAVLFGVAWLGDRRAREGKVGWLRSPLVYTLSISIYCTSWTFYGAVGLAARDGLDFTTIYLGPTLIFVGWWWLLRKLLRIGRSQRITSIADLISSRYGKSASLAVLVTTIAVMGTTPYIALQLQSIALSFQTLTGAVSESETALLAAIGLSVFTILFGTRSLDANERHHGVVAAIALEALVKLGALVAVGLFVTFGISSGFGGVFERMPEDLVRPSQLFDPRWTALLFLSSAAIICLPRQFQVTVVENIDEKHLATASWMFPLYMFLMTLFVLPIAITGLNTSAVGANPDMFVLTVPLQEGRSNLAMLAFIGGFSSATSMVIVAAIAISTMVSNHIIMPIALMMYPRGTEPKGDLRGLLLMSRRLAILAILFLGYLYFELTGGSNALASIGLIAFAGIAQVLPSLLMGLFWRGATKAGALAGLGAGFLLWVYTLALPSFEGGFLMSKSVLEHGPFGIEMLRPQALLGVEGSDPLVYSLVWSVGVNTLLLFAVSLFTSQSALERLQAALFVDVFHNATTESHRFIQRSAASEDLFALAQRILGGSSARRLFSDIAREQGVRVGMPKPTDAFIGRLERELAGSVGAASAHAMVSRVVGAEAISLTELIEIADETQRLIETSRQLSEKSAELEQTLQQLREANDRLRALDAQKDAFLSQISHELRTPMTSVLSFSEILLGEDEPTTEEAKQFISIIHSESLRLTRLLDELLDLSRLESGTTTVPTEPLDPSAEVRAVLASMAPLFDEKGVRMTVGDLPQHVLVRANSDRIRQVLINLLTNAVKYNDNPEPEIRVEARATRRQFEVDVIDNGGGVSRDEADVIFEKFARGNRSKIAQGTGLGLPISRAIMQNMGGDLTVEFNPDGASFFRLSAALQRGDA